MASKYKKGISIALAVRNEEASIGACLERAASWATEIVVVDGGSTDRTVEIARSFGAKVIETDNPKIFHINKQRALEACSCEWILQIDADEGVSDGLVQEILRVVDGTDVEPLTHASERLRTLFIRHQKLVQERDGINTPETGAIVGYYIPRCNYFLGGPMHYAGTYPDGVIRLVKNGFASFPARSVHEQIVCSGRISWLTNDLIHYSNPTMKKYLRGAIRYTSLQSSTITNPYSLRIFCIWMFIKPIRIFLELFIRHKGMLDGWRGFLFSFFSCLLYPAAYIVTLFQKTQ